MATGNKMAWHCTRLDYKAFILPLLGRRWLMTLLMGFPLKYNNSVPTFS
jgi:hypothetical protein